MTTPDLAGIIERDRAWDRNVPRRPSGDTTRQRAADRRALLGLLRETREALDTYGDHSSVCRGWRGLPCNCGFVDARAALAALAAP